MDYTTIISTAISSLLALVGTIIGAYTGIKKSNQLTVYRIEQLEKKVDKHNQVIDRVHELERGAAVMNEDIKVANHRIEDLERK